MERNITQEEIKLSQLVEPDRGQASRSDGIARIIAWFLLGFSAATFLVALALLLLVPSHARGPNSYGSDYLIGFVLLFYSALGALIAVRHSKNPIGWIFIVMGLGSELHILSIGFLIYVHYHNPNSIQLPLIIFSLFYNPFILERAFGPLGLLIFPDGRFISSRWRIVGWVPVALGGLWYFFSVPAPVAGLPVTLFHPIVQSVIPSISSAMDTTIAVMAGFLIEALFVAATVGIVLRLRLAKGEQREQLKWFVYACILAASITLGLTLLDSIPMLLASLSGTPGSATSGLALLREIAYGSIPAAAFIAIYKYHLYDIDLIINRTLVYVPLTAILAGLYAASVSLFQRIFIASTGQKSDAAFVISSLILAGMFTPIRNSLQASVDKRFKEPADPLKNLKIFGKQVELVTGILDPRQATRKLLDISIIAFHASGGALYLLRAGEMMLEHASGDWKKGNGAIHLPLTHLGTQLGLLELGVRKDRKGYSFEDRQVLQQEVGRVAELVWLTQNLGLDERSTSLSDRE